MSRTICTFNAMNLFARYRFGRTFPGDRTQASAADEGWGFLPQYGPGAMELYNEEQRRLCARAMRGEGGKLPDVLCLQEVESLNVLRLFNEQYLGGHYRYAVLLDSRDQRQIDVGVLSRLEIARVRSHVDLRDPAPDEPGRPWLFSRDCLEVDVELNRSGSRTLTLFLNHLKSKYAETAEERLRADRLRHRQAAAVRRIVQRRFAGRAFGRALFAVVGDLNDEPASPVLAPLLERCDLVDAFERIPNEHDRWTHWYRSDNTVGTLDYVLLSPALERATRGAVPVIERRGISFARVLADGRSGPRQTRYVRREDDPAAVDVDFRFGRFPEVRPDLYASDHCPVVFEVT